MLAHPIRFRRMPTSRPVDLPVGHHGGTRTRNLRLRRATRRPLRHVMSLLFEASVPVEIIDSEQLWKIPFNFGGKLVVGEAGYSSLPSLRRLLEIAAIPVGAPEVKHGQRVVGIEGERLLVGVDRLRPALEVCVR